MGPLDGIDSSSASMPPGSRWSKESTSWLMATLVVAATLVFMSGPVTSFEALHDDGGVCPEVPVAARARCLDHRAFTLLVTPVTFAVVLSVAAAIVAGATDRRPAFVAALTVASALLIGTFVWFVSGGETSSRNEIGGATAWLSLVAVLMAWTGWRTRLRVTVGLVATVSCLLVVQDAISSW
jgi:hypothetical protein